jgi:ABC-type dipeptide/oligopeptide/nickel transport system permease component
MMPRPAAPEHRVEPEEGRGAVPASDQGIRPAPPASSSLGRYLGRRVLLSVLTLIGVIVLVFFASRILPGDPAAARAGQYATEETIARIREQYGLDRPLPEQFVTYVTGVFTGDLGTSSRTDQPVLEELLRRLPASLELALYSLVLALIAAIPLGVIAAAKRGSAFDTMARLWAIFGSSMALFWLGLLLIYFLFFRLGWFPGPVGRLPIGESPPRMITGLYTVDALLAGQPGLVVTSLQHLALPVLTFAVVVTAPILKMVRSAMIRTLRSDYIRTARAVGVSETRILLVDGLRNAMLPVLTTVGIVFGYLMGGNVIVEFLFSWPGIGSYAYQAVQTNDLEALQGFVILVGILYIALNVAIDLLYGWINPQVRIGARQGDA